MASLFNTDALASLLKATTQIHLHFHHLHLSFSHSLQENCRAMLTWPTSCNPASTQHMTFLNNFLTHLLSIVSHSLQGLFQTFFLFLKILNSFPLMSEGLRRSKSFHSFLLLLSSLFFPYALWYLSHKYK